MKWPIWKVECVAVTQLNPIASSIIVNQQAVTRQAAAQSEHIHREHARSRNVTSTGDRYEHEAVESTEELDAAHDENKKRKPPEDGGRKKKPADDRETPPISSPHLDLTA
jgi:hypothetical protein